MKPNYHRVVCHKQLVIFIVILLISLFCSNQPAHGLENGLAKTPPMGWMTWERFTCDINCSGKNELNCIGTKLIERTAKAIKSKGFLKAGYDYVNIDDCWSELKRSQDGKLIPDLKRFGGDTGLKNLSATVRGLGLKLGIYGDCGDVTCARYPAQLARSDSAEGNHFETDAQSFYEWGIESFKFDGCNIKPGLSETICPGMTAALNKTRKPDQKPILLTCEWPFYIKRNEHGQPRYELAAQSCNMFRFMEDVVDSWESVLEIIDFAIGMQEIILPIHGPGGWFDPDQLVIGNFGLSTDEARAQMVIWALWSAPLIMSNDVEKLTQTDIDLLQNEMLISVNQDKLGIWGQMIHELPVVSNSKMQVFVKTVEPNSEYSICPSYVIGYLFRGNLGNSQIFSLPVRDLLKNSTSLIVEANKRRNKEEYTPECLKLISGTNKTTRIAKLQVRDLLGDELPDEDKTLLMDGELKLEVNPSGIRVVKLTIV